MELSPSKAADLQPRVHAASGYAAHFGANGQRADTPFVEGQCRATLPRAALRRITGIHTFGDGVVGKLDATRRHWLSWWEQHHAEYTGRAS